MLSDASSSLLTEQPFSLAVLDAACSDRAAALASRLGLTVSAIDDDRPQLRLGPEGLLLAVPGLGKPLCIDFSAGKYDHRRRFGGGRGQPLARAIGLRHGRNPTVIDATAGFARDAFVLASLGCQVTMLERSPIMALLVEDAMQRAQQDSGITPLIARMRLVHADAIAYLDALAPQHRPEVIYLDPMYPSRDKRALVKKEMQLLHRLAGPDTDSALLLDMARRRALKRVVVKRPKGAAFVGERIPSTSIQSKNTRFDIYLTG